MKNAEAYDRIFCEVFSAEQISLNHEFDILSVDNWDSITQLTLVTEMENEFDVLFDTEDIMDFKSYDIGKKILKRYGVEL